MGLDIIPKLRKNLSAIPGWRTDRKLVVIESDDRGSLRMPSVKSYVDLQEAGLDLVADEGALFNKYDTLAGIDDLSGLFSVLESVSDSSDRPVVITPVSVVANPDFDKIRQSGFTRYFLEPFTETFRKYSGCEDSFTLWQEGIQRRLFVPQFHGREHLNVGVWMRALSSGNKIAMTGFNHCFWGMTTKGEREIGVEFQAAFDFTDPADLLYHREVLSDGLKMFADIFGYNASYFAPPNGPFSSTLESLLAEKGIKYLSMPRFQSEPAGHGKTQKRLHWIGKNTRSGLTILTRNCFFEPVVPGIDWVDRCLYDMSVAFRWKKPAVISSHRVNFVGGLSLKNRDEGLHRLHNLLKLIMKRWPEAEFVTSKELGDIIRHG